MKELNDSAERNISIIFKMPGSEYTARSSVTFILSRAVAA